MTMKAQNARFFALRDQRLSRPFSLRTLRLYRPPGASSIAQRFRISN
jgi:hypothetical protein